MADNQQSGNVNHSIDSRRTARDGDRITNFAVATVKPYMDFQTSMWRQFSINCEQVARNFENAIGVFVGNTPPSDSSQQQQH